MDVNPKQRRRHGAAFKAQVLAACAELGASVAAVALSFGLNDRPGSVERLSELTESARSHHNHAPEIPLRGKASRSRARRRLSARAWVTFFGQTRRPRCQSASVPFGRAQSPCGCSLVR